MDDLIFDAQKMLQNKTPPPQKKQQQGAPPSFPQKDGFGWCLFFVEREILLFQIIFRRCLEPGQRRAISVHGDMSQGSHIQLEPLSGFGGERGIQLIFKGNLLMFRLGEALKLTGVIFASFHGTHIFFWDQSWWKCYGKLSGISLENEVWDPVSPVSYDFFPSKHAKGPSRGLSFQGQIYSPCFSNNHLGGGFKSFLFSPRKLGKIPIFDLYFSNGLKPPTSHGSVENKHFGDKHLIFHGPRGHHWTTADGSEIRLTTWHVWNPVSNGIFTISTGAWFFPSTVWLWEVGRSYAPEIRTRNEPRKNGAGLWVSEFGEIIIWVFPKIGGFPPKSSILIRFSIINHPFWGTFIFGNTHFNVAKSGVSDPFNRWFEWFFHHLSLNKVGCQPVANGVLFKPFFE